MTRSRSSMRTESFIGKSPSSPIRGDRHDSPAIEISNQTSFGLYTLVRGRVGGTLVKSRLLRCLIIPCVRTSDALSTRGPGDASSWGFLILVPAWDSRGRGSQSSPRAAHRPASRTTGQVTSALIGAPRSARVRRCSQLVRSCPSAPSDCGLSSADPYASELTLSMMA